jgi:hypothetical protein
VGDDFLREVVHFGFERLGLQHEQFDAGGVEVADAQCYLLTAADQPVSSGFVPIV